jgi:hypothetical protein
MDLDDNDQSLAGMTPNERLSSTGLMRQWDDACRRRDRSAMELLLQQVEIPPSEAAKSVEMILSHPEVYLRHLGLGR